MKETGDDNRCRGQHVWKKFRLEIFLGPNIGKFKISKRDLMI